VLGSVLTDSDAASSRIDHRAARSALGSRIGIGVDQEYWVWGIRLGLRV